MALWSTSTPPATMPSSYRSSTPRPRPMSTRVAREVAAAAAGGIRALSEERPVAAALAPPTRCLR